MSLNLSLDEIKDLNSFLERKFTLKDREEIKLSLLESIKDIKNEIYFERTTTFKSEKFNIVSTFFYQNDDNRIYNLNHSIIYNNSTSNIFMDENIYIIVKTLKNKIDIIYHNSYMMIRIYNEKSIPLVLNHIWALDYDIYIPEYIGECTEETLTYLSLL